MVELHLCFGLAGLFCGTISNCPPVFPSSYWALSDWGVHLLVSYLYSFSYCSWGFSRQEYWSGLPFPFPEDLPDPGIQPGSPALQADDLPTEL